MGGGGTDKRQFTVAHASPPPPHLLDEMFVHLLSLGFAVSQGGGGGGGGETTQLKFSR